jgi:hypothetical protein
MKKFRKVCCVLFARNSFILYNLFVFVAVEAEKRTKAALEGKLSPTTIAKLRTFFCLTFHMKTFSTNYTFAEVARAAKKLASEQKKKDKMKGNEEAKSESEEEEETGIDIFDDDAAVDAKLEVNKCLFVCDDVFKYCIIL